MRVLILHPPSRHHSSLASLFGSRQNQQPLPLPPPPPPPPPSEEDIGPHQRVWAWICYTRQWKSQIKHKFHLNSNEIEPYNAFLYLSQEFYYSITKRWVPRCIITLIERSVKVFYEFASPCDKCYPHVRHLCSSSEH